MKQISIKAPNLQADGPILEVIIAPSSAYQKTLKEQKRLIPKSIKKRLLIDTGSSVSAIKFGVAQELNLTPHGTITIATASHNSVLCPTYDVDIIFPNQLVISDFQVFESKFEGQNIDGLIGRDILSKGLLIYSGYDNSFTLGF